MPTTPTKQGQLSDKAAYERVTRSFLPEELSCTKVFDKFHEDVENGSIVGIAGDDFAIIATDAQQPSESNQALHRIRDKLVLATTGDQCCTAQLASLLRARMFMYEYRCRRVMPSKCVAMLLSCILTNQRCHRNHVATMLAGLDHRGKGVIYAYNPLGYHDAVKFRAMGAAYAVLQPILSKRLTPQPVPTECESLDTNPPPEMQAIKELSLGNAKTSVARPPKIKFDEAFDLVVCSFKAAACNANVYTGNVLILDAVTRQGRYTHEIMLKEQGKSLECWT